MNETEQLRAHVERWKRVGPQLEAFRLGALRQVVTADAVAQLAPAFAVALRLPLRLTSGLVEQQAIFKRLHKQP